MAAALMSGQLTIEVKEAKDLYNVNLIAKMDPFCTLSVGFSEEKFRTRPAKDGHKNPKWDQSFIFNLTGKEDALHIQVWSRGGVSDTQIGRLDILLPQLNFGVPAWYNVVARDNFSKVNGQILLVFHFNGKGARASVMGTPVIAAITPVTAAATATVAAVPLTTSDFVEVTKSAAPLPTPVPSPPPSASAPTYVAAYPSLEGQPPAYAQAMAPSPPPYESAVSAPHPPGGLAVSPVHGTPVIAAIAAAPSVVGSGSGIAANQYPGNSGYATYSTPIRPVMAVAPGHAGGYIQSSSTSSYPGHTPTTYAQMVATPSGYVTSPAVVYSGYASQPQVLAVTMPVHYIAPGPPTASSTLPYQVATPTQVQFPSTVARPGAPYATSTVGVQYPAHHRGSVAGVNIITANTPNNNYASQPAPAFSTYPGQR